jgi:DNA-binding LytR/AlgR family response regulator
MIVTENIEVLIDQLSQIEEDIQQFYEIYRKLKPDYSFLIAIPITHGLEFINYKEIEYIKAEGSYSEILMIDRRKILISLNLREIQLHLPESTFCRIHNSYIINLRLVRKFVKKGGTSAIMALGESIPISRSKKNDFLRSMNNFIYNKLKII